MLKRLVPLAIAGTVGFLLASLLNGGTPANAISKTSDQVKLANYSGCLAANNLMKGNNAFIYFEGAIGMCATYLK